MMIYRIRARQGSYGIPASPGVFLQLCESHGEAFLSIETGTPVACQPVCTLPDSATAEQIFDALSELEQWGETYQQQCARIRADYPDEDENSYPPATLDRLPTLLLDS